MRMTNAEDVQGFTAGRAELGAGPIRYREIGSGEPLLFVHGWGVNGSLWTETARALAAAGPHRCILPDLPFGSHSEPLAPDADLSPTGAAAIVAELIETLGLERVTIVGNDSGGAVSQILATTHPELLGRLVLTNSDCLEVFPPGIFKALVRMVRLPGGMDLLANALRQRAVQRSPSAYGSLSKRRIPDEMLDAWVRPPIDDLEIRRDSRKFASGMDPAHTLAAAELLGGLEIPVLLCWGEQDRFFTIEHAERLQALIPDCRLVRMKESLTFVPIDEPERLAAEIATFVAATSAAAVSG